MPTSTSQQTWQEKMKRSGRCRQCGRFRGRGISKSLCLLCLTKRREHNRLTRGHNFTCLSL